MSHDGGRFPKIKDPNKLAETQDESDQAMLGGSCQFLGKTYYQGDTICYQQSVWICDGSQWKNTNTSC